MAGSRATVGGWSDRLAAYASLVRVPNLFTAPPDVVLGAALVAAVGRSVEAAVVAGLTVASILLYAAGTTLNDYVDAEVDAVERPERPIPSGAVPRRRALALGLALLGAAIAVAGVAAGPAGAAAAGAVAVAILAYDGWLKGTGAGFVAMGTTRGLNVLLGVTAAGWGPFDLPAVLLVPPATVAGYVAALTFMAERETEGDNRGAVAVAGGASILAAVVAAGATLWWQESPLAIAVGIGLAGGFLAWVGGPLCRAYHDPVPGTVGPAVGRCVLGLVVLDAAFAAVAGVRWSLVAAGFLLPAVGLARVFNVS